MTTDDVRDALVNYHRYKRRLENANLDLIAIVTKQTKTGGSIIRMPEHPTDKTKFILKCIEDKTVIERRCAYWRDMVYLADAFIRALPNTPQPYRDIVKDKYINLLNDNKMEVKYNYSRMQIYRLIKNAIIKYVEES
jgi:hypothetical protein